MFLVYFTDDFIGDAGPFAQLCQVQLPHFSIEAHVVHQIVGVSFAERKPFCYLLRGASESKLGESLAVQPQRASQNFAFCL